MHHDHALLNASAEAAHRREPGSAHALDGQDGEGAEVSVRLVGDDHARARLARPAALDTRDDDERARLALRAQLRESGT